MRLKLIKRVFYFIVGLLVAGGIGVLFCAFNPALTEKLAERIEQFQSEPDHAGEVGEDSGNTGSEDSTLEAPIPGSDENGNSGTADTGNLTEEPYEVPEDFAPVLPESVQNLSGVKPIDEEALEIDSEEADHLGSILAPGAIGENEEFPARYYPYYHMLDEALQKLYKQIYANAKELTISFAPAISVTKEQVRKTFEAVYNDHPELFWLETGYSCKYLGTGICVEITLKYNKTANDLENAKKNFEDCCRKLLDGCADLSTALEKERYLHDALIQITEYDELASMNQSAYSCIVQGKSVCAGYARAFQYLMQQLGIPCYYCTGIANEEHAWNIVRLDERYANVDVTWDDTEPPSYDYYNKSDAAYGLTHARTGLAVNLPACAEVPEEAEDGQSGVDAWINPNPILPLEWTDREEEDEENPESGEGDASADESAEDEKKRQNMEKAGVTEAELVESLDEYYADCLAHLSGARPGSVQFSNVIPEEMWALIESVYSSGIYWNGYVEDALEKLGASNFDIQLSVQRLGGGYYRLYHNTYIY